MLDDLPTPPSSTKVLTHAAKRLAKLAADLGHHDVAESIREDAKRRLHDGRVRIVILGEIKHGKSTLVNALLGEPLLPVGVTPTTGAVVAIRVDPQQSRTGTYLVSPAGERSELEAERFEALVRGKDHDEAGRTPELLVDAEHLPPTLEIIDTPGFNDIDRFRAAVSRSELPRADVLVLVLDATQVLARSELGLIRDAIAAVGGLDDSGARCLLVINRIDLVPEDERGRIVEHIREGLASVIPGQLEPYLTDAKAALRAATSGADSGDAPEPVRAVFRLREELWGLAGREREILPARARASLLRHAKLLSYNAAIQARAVQLERAKVLEEIAAVEQAMASQATDLASLRKTIAEAGARIVTASEERLASFRAELEEAASAQIHKADIQTLTQVFPGAIQDAFLDFVQHESERLRLELEQLTRDVFSTCGELARRRLGEATLPLGFRGPGVYVEPPKIIIEVAMLALGLVGTVIWYLGNTMTGMIMTIASPLTTVILREKTVRDARVQAREALPAALDRAIGDLRGVVGAVVERHGEALDEHLMLADRALSEQLLDGLRRAEQRLATHEARVTEQAAKDAQRSEAKQAEAEAGEASEASESEAEQATEDEKQEAKADAPLPEEVALQRMRERVSAAAEAEVGILERRLERLIEELESLKLDELPAGPEPETPTVLH
jgi:small GTP-binding protein